MRTKADWFSDLDRPQRRAFWACFGGWALDAMDVQIYALVLPAIVAAWSLTQGEAGLLGTAALASSSLGGVVAGNLADRFGRVRVLQVSILWFSLFTFLSGLTQGFWQMLIARTLQGFGFGGEWAAGAVLMAELLSPRYRGRTIAAVSSGWSVGYGVAALLFAVVFQIVEESSAWRVMFFIGVLPALMIFYIRRAVTEPPLYLVSRHREKAGKPPAIREIFRRPLRRKTLISCAMCFGVLGGNYTVLAWLPAYLQIERHLSTSGTGAYLLVNIFGSFLGYNVGGGLSDRYGRRNAISAFAVVGAISAVSYLMFASNPLMVLLMGLPLGFAQSALNAGIAPLLSEIYPTRLRATGQGFCYNAGRGLGAVLPACVGFAAGITGLTLAICLAAAVAYALVLVCVSMLDIDRASQLSRVGLRRDAVPVEEAA